MPAHSVELPPHSVAVEIKGDCANPDLTSTSTQLVRMTAGAARGMGLARLGADCLQRIVSGPDLLLNSAKVWLKNDPDHRVALIDADAASPDALWCCKVAVSGRWWVRFISRYASVRAWNAFRQGLILRGLQISTPQPLAVVTVEARGIYHEYLLTEAVPGAVSLEKWLQALGTHETPDNAFWQRVDVGRQLGALLQRLHEERFDHRDLKPTNLLMSHHGQVWLIDLDGVWRWPSLPQSRRVQNLARLWAGLVARRRATPADALRFLLAYLRPRERGDWRSLWRQVARCATKIIARKK